MKTTCGREPRELTPEECRWIFMTKMVSLIDYWEEKTGNQRTGPMTDRKKLEGLMRSVFVVISGCSSLPGFALCPIPSEEDKPFCKETGMDWWPESTPDIGDHLHRLLDVFIRKEIPRPDFIIEDYVIGRKA